MVSAEEKDPIGKTARFLMAVLHAIPYDLPAPARVAELMDKLERCAHAHLAPVLPSCATLLPTSPKRR